MKLLSGITALTMGLCVTAYAADTATGVSSNSTIQQASTPTMAQSADVQFLENKKKEKEVVTLPSGLQYKILVEGKGAKPSATDTVTVNYAGTFIDGREFDSSYKRGQPASFPVNRVIAGWTEALQLMPVGSTWMLYIPSDLAYGPMGSPPIGPNKTLVFKVELLGISAK